VIGSCELSKEVLGVIKDQEFLTLRCLLYYELRFRSVDLWRFQRYAYSYVHILFAKYDLCFEV